MMGVVSLQPETVVRGFEYLLVTQEDIVWLLVGLMSQ